MEKAPLNRARIFPFAALAAAVFAMAPAAHAVGASFAIAPATLAVASGGQFTVSVLVNAEQAVNAAQGTVTFPADKLRVVGVSKSGSILQFWSPDPSFSNANGTVSFAGGLPSPGFVGANGTVLRITFKATAPGTATVNITQGAILANDGQGTNVLTGISHGTYAIGPDAPASTAPAEVANRVVSATHPDSNRWYNAAAARFSWNVPPETDKVSYAFDQKPDTTPSEAAAATDQAEYQLDGRPDGAWYFHLQLRTSGSWGSVFTKKIKVDRTPPEPPVIRAVTADPADPRPEFRWSSEDGMSGIAGYRLQVSGGEWLVPEPKEARSFVLPARAPGKRLLAVEASDAAGNTSVATLAFEVDPIALPAIVQYPKTVTQDASGGAVNQPIVIEGTAKEAATVTTYLRKSSDVLVFTAPVAEDGSWETAYSGALGSGTWTLTAQAKDARGALSLETDPVLIQANSRAGDLIRFFAAWGAVALIALLGITLLVFAFLAASARLRHYRLKLRREILAAQVAFIKDFEQLEKDLDGGRAARLREKVTHDMDMLAKDIGKELERLKKDIG